MKKRYIALGVVGGLLMIGMLASDPKPPADAKQVAAIAAAEADAGGVPAANDENAVLMPVDDEPVDDGLTPQQRNARRSAESYLSMKGFSREGLIHQLSSDAGEGYAKADATAAVDSLTVDWNEHAARTAQSYLEMSGFSCKRLIRQLSSSAGEKFTPEQARYGATQAGAC